VLSASLVRGTDVWQACARSNDGELVSGWTVSAPTTVATTAQIAALTLSATAAPTRSGQAEVAVALSAPAVVEVSICNLAGRVVAVLPAKTLPAGMSSLLWNTRSATGTPVPAGTYLVGVTARTAGGGQSRSFSAMTVTR
jgi:flagellar hook assembly protein FlgD